ncbi:MAG: DUF6338 family protein [Pseudomonadota bacterium]
MNELLSLPYELQIVLVSGYLAHKVSTIGRSEKPSTEDLVLQVLTMGLIGRICFLGIVDVWSNWFPSTQNDVSSDGARLMVVGVCTVLCSLVIAAVWRKWGVSIASRIMSSMGVYRDDHQSSTWDSIFREKVAWAFIQVHVDDGRVLESKFDLVPDTAPVGKITLNSDGIALYVTGIYDTQMSRTVHSPTDESYGHILTYVPANTIKQVEIGLKP